MAVLQKSVLLFTGQMVFARGKIAEARGRLAEDPRKVLIPDATTGANETLIAEARGRLAEGSRKVLVPKQFWRKLAEGSRKVCGRFA